MPDEALREKQQAPVQAYVPQFGAASPAGGLAPDSGLVEGNTDFPANVSEPWD